MSPAENVINLNLKEQTDALLKTLTPREERVIKMRFGIGDGSEHTLEEVGQSNARGLVPSTRYLHWGFEMALARRVCRGGGASSSSRSRVVTMCCASSCASPESNVPTARTDRHPIC